jgi:hypothetical protein
MEKHQQLQKRINEILYPNIEFESIDNSKARKIITL